MQFLEKINLLEFDLSEQIRSYLYLIVDSGEALLIDAHIGPEAENVLKAIEEIIELDQLTAVALTHGHYDHIGACPLIKERTNAEIAAHIADAQYIEDPWTQFLMLYQHWNPTKEEYQNVLQNVGGRGVRVTNPLHDEDILKVGSIKLEVVHTPGHSPGSICLFESEAKVLFSGDAIIPSDWFSNMLGVIFDARSHLRSLERLSKMDVEVLCPGHKPMRRGAEVGRELSRHIDRYNEIESNVIEIVTESDGFSLSETTEGVVERVLSPDVYEESVTALMTVRAFLHKLCFEGKLVQEKGPVWRALER